jgi:ribosomal protein L19
MPWMVDMLEYMKTTLTSRMNEDAANKERLEELVTIVQADNTKLRLDIEENTKALVKSLVGDIFNRVRLKSQYYHDMANIKEHCATLAVTRTFQAISEPIHQITRH